MGTKCLSFRTLVNYGIIAILIIVFINIFVGNPTTVDDTSAINGIKPNKTYFLCKLCMRFGELKQGELVQYGYTSPDTKITSSIMGRVIGLPGEKVEISNKTILINGDAYSGAQMDWSNWSSSESASIVLSQDEYYLDLDIKTLGDGTSLNKYIEKHKVNLSNIEGKILTGK